MNAPWQQPDWILRTQEILDSYQRLLKADLIDRSGTDAEQAERLFNAPFVVLAHGTQADPILNYGNAAALTLWELDLPELTAMPSRLTAEPMLRDERAKLLERVTRDGYIDDYSGVRISSTGRRFQIDRATVWNLTNALGEPTGQAATFGQWRELPASPSRPA